MTADLTSSCDDTRKIEDTKIESLSSIGDDWKRGFGGGFENRTKLSKFVDLFEVEVIPEEMERDWDFVWSQYAQIKDS